ncbi:hypothetical protein PYCC9005_001012 [Savitreella phatthalungensis]
MPSGSLEQPSWLSERDGEHIVIIGAGVIGVSTAYHCRQHPLFDAKKDRITIIEAVCAAAGASGKAGGLLAEDWHGQATASLGKLSFALHDALAKKHKGGTRWDYRRTNAISIECDAKRKMRSPQIGKSKVPKEVDWIDGDLVTRYNDLGDTSTMAQVHPRRFCRALLADTRAQGCVRYVLGRVSDIHRGRVCYTPVRFDDFAGTEYGRTTAENSRPEDAVPIPDETRFEQDDELITISDATRIVITAGPWSARILGDRADSLPISGQRAHSITLRTPQAVSPHAVFTECRFADGTRSNPEMYARVDEVYTCGEGDSDVPLPQTAADVVVDHARTQALIDQTLELSPVLRDLARSTAATVVGSRQACYLPIVTGVTRRARGTGAISDTERSQDAADGRHNGVGDTAGLKGQLYGTAGGPLVGKLCAGLYIAAGHSCWGISLAPGTGKVMAEIIWDGDVARQAWLEHSSRASSDSAAQVGWKKKPLSADIRWLDPLNAVDELW